MTDYGNGGRAGHMPGDESPEPDAIDDLFDRSDWPPTRHQPQERSDRSPADSDLRYRCGCSHLSVEAMQKAGPHHDDRCPLYELPDYGVFGPDE